MNLFKTLAGILSGDTDITIVIRKTGESKLVVSTNLNNHGVEDPAKAVIAPFVVTGSPEELDTEYISIITEPLEKSTGLQTSMKNFEASAKAAKAASKAAAELKQKEDSAKREAKNAVTKLITEGDKLLKANKYRQAKDTFEKAVQEAEKNKLPDELKKAKAGLAEAAKKDVPDMFESFSMGNTRNAETVTDEPGNEEPIPSEGNDGEETDPDPEEEPDNETEGAEESEINPLDFN